MLKLSKTYFKVVNDKRLLDTNNSGLLRLEYFYQGLLKK